MAQYIITERRPVYEFFEYIVEAESEEEALVKIDSEDCSHHWIEDSSEEPLITITKQ